MSKVAFTPALFKSKLWGVKAAGALHLGWFEHNLRTLVGAKQSGSGPLVRIGFYKWNEVVHHWCKHDPRQSQEALYLHVFGMIGTGGEVYNFWLRKQVSGDKTWGCDKPHIWHKPIFCNTFCLLQIASLEMHVYRNYLANVVWPSVCRFAPPTRTSMKITCRRSIT